MSRRAWFVVSIVGFGGAVALGLITDDERILTLAIQTFILGALALSWNILGGFTGLVSLGHAAFFGLGALITREMWLGERPLILAVAVAVVVTSVAAAVVGVPMLRFRGIYFSVGTLALGVAVWLTAGNLWPGISSLPAESLRTYDFVPRYFYALAVIVVSALMSMWILRSKLGLGMMAVREDEEAASATGVNAFAYKMIAFILSAAMAALAGSAFAYFSASYYPQFPFGVVWTFEAITVVFVGGVGTIVGPIIGTTFFVAGRDVLNSTFPELQVVIFGVLFILVVLVLPGGFVEGGQKLFRLVSRSNANQPPDNADADSAQQRDGKERV